MKAVVYRRHGEPSDVLSHEDLSTPSRLGRSDVLVRVTRRMVHPIDGLLLRGVIPMPIAEGGSIPGGDGVGVVEQIGPDVDARSGIAPGQRVMLFPVHGTWAERVIAPAATVMPVPDDVGDDVASQIVINGITAIALLRAALSAQAQAISSGPLLVTAAGSSVGRNLIELARLRGVKVVGLVRNDVGASILAPHVTGVPVVSMEREDWAQLVVSAAGGAPSVVIDPIGGGMTGRWLELLCDGGTVLTYGGMDARPSSVSTIAMTSRQLTIKGLNAYGWAASASPEQRQADLAELFEITRRAPQHFTGYREFPLAEAVAALTAAQASPRRGAVILSSGA